MPFALHFDDISGSGKALAWLVMTIHLVLAAVLGDRMRAERERRAAEAAAEERARIARELHDGSRTPLGRSSRRPTVRYAARPRRPSAAPGAADHRRDDAREAQGERRRALGCCGPKPLRSRRSPVA